MDHVPRTPGRQDADHKWQRSDIVRVLGQVVHGCLKRVLWRTQEIEAKAYGPVQVDWWAPHYSASEIASFAINGFNNMQGTT